MTVVFKGPSNGGTVIIRSVVAGRETIVNTSTSQEWEVLVTERRMRASLKEALTHKIREVILMEENRWLFSSMTHLPAGWKVGLHDEKRRFFWGVLTEVDHDCPLYECSGAPRDPWVLYANNEEDGDEGMLGFSFMEKNFSVECLMTLKRKRKEV